VKTIKPPPRSQNGRSKGRSGLREALRERILSLFNASFYAKVLFVTILALAIVCLGNIGPLNRISSPYEKGEVAPITVRADRDIKVDDTEATDLQKMKAMEDVEPLFILNGLIGSLITDRTRALFRRGRSLVSTGEETIPPSFAEDFEKLFGEDSLSPDPSLEASPEASLAPSLETSLETSLAPSIDPSLDPSIDPSIDPSTSSSLSPIPSSSLLARVLRENFSRELENSLIWLTIEILSQGVIEDDASLSEFSGKNVIVSRAGTGPVSIPFDSLLTLGRAGSIARSRAELIVAESDLDDPELLKELSMRLIKPNLILDKEALESQRQKMANVVPTAFKEARKGEIIVREGEILSPSQILILNALRGSQGEKRIFTKSNLGIFIILIVFLSVTQAIAFMDRQRARGIRELILMGFILFMYIGLSWLSIYLGQRLPRGFEHMESHVVFLAMPIPAAAMLAVIFLGNRRAVPITFLGSILGAFLAPLDTFEAFIYLCNGSLISILFLRRISERGRFIPSILLCSTVNALTVWGLSLVDGARITLPFFDLTAAVLSGVLSGILASGLVPIIELIMGFTTNFKLMELGNLNRPLLNELMLGAPGTYHHSVIVGSMVEAAAEAIGANPHLAKVGAYYHDIGKIRKPNYFVENQGSENRHDSLTPAMSVRLLIAHVKDGVNIARANKLPKEVTDIVEQHHGTSLMSFFYHKALENRRPNSPEINPGDFRYPGPKPASKEAGLVMLADICEAATRSLTEPTPAKIQELVKTLINRTFDDGQLAASALILIDLTETTRVFVNILTGIYHRRVTYPVLSKDSAKTQAYRSKVIYGDINQEPSKRLAH
jgi:putative nucleotidyltransferase with HDIG domain